MEINQVNQVNARFVMPSTAAGDPLQSVATAYRRIEAERDRNCWIHVRPIAETRDQCRAEMARAGAGEALPLLGKACFLLVPINVQPLREHLLHGSVGRLVPPADQVHQRFDDEEDRDRHRDQAQATHEEPVPERFGPSSSTGTK